MENAELLSMFVLATIAMFLASTTLLFGVLWRRERAMRRKLQSRLRAQEASFAAALGQTQRIVERSAEQTERLAQLELEFARARPVIREMATIVSMNAAR